MWDGQWQVQQKKTWNSCFMRLKIFFPNIEIDIEI